MKKAILLIVAFVGLGLAQSYAQNYNNWAVGLKVGEPLGLNIRKYFASGTKNFDVNIGTYGLLWGQYRKYQNGVYYDKSIGVMLQGIYHWNQQLGAAERFQVYYGFGGQINSRRREINRESYRPISLGGVGNVGMEYSLPNNDLGIFTDAGLYVEAIPKPLFLAVNANIGLRLNIGR